MNVENAPEASGFPALARRIALNPDYESFIFRKFDRLSARNLLHLEGKLAYLEYKLDQADKQALNAADNESHRSMRAWEAFEQNSEDAQRPESAHMKIAEQIRETLEKYQEALLRQNQIAVLEQPNKRALAVARHLSGVQACDAAGNTRRRHLLSGLSEQRLDEDNRRDLVAVRKPAEKDVLSRFLQDHWFLKTTSVGNDDFEYIKEDHVNWVAAGVSTIAAASLLFGAILMLHFVRDENTQLVLIGLLTVLFALSVGVLTNAKRAEVFAASAAYAAVLVVFVSSDTAPSSCTCTVQSAVP
ncbi:hypothetical protein QBC34DRAFT_103664 [Podospora aff. communis PSN243]|uniref:DUF6594 domain-containing protein n=1 Tax=Podospora aff. communis PSN243 TaxID=3040156 RepID=A0AAV9H2K8_9PEZI|nr:hypothetical protein QBC34DRAFT_103664 [Podospora aff. communis PSN243]